MSERAETKTWSMDVALAVIVVAAAMYFLPPLRKILLWPEVALAVVFAGLLAVTLIQRRKEPKVTYSFTPPPAAQVATGSTEFIRKSLGDQVSGLDWLSFEQLVIGLYGTLGYSGKRCAGPHSDDSVDIVLTKNKTRTFAQCKHWKKSEVDEKELKEFLDTLVREKMENGIFVTAREFTFSARRFAAMNNMLLVGLKDLVRMLEGANWKENLGLQGTLRQSKNFCTLA